MTAFNPWKALEGLLAGPPQQAGVVQSIDGNVATIELPGGGLLTAIGPAVVGQTVFVRGGVIEGDAAGIVSIEVIDI